jgi:phosphoadenosine phosphosulfate reductase
VARQDPGIPVILIDTGYLFPETYQFIEQLEKQLALNIQRFASPQSVPDFEQQHGKLWEQGREGLDQYLELRKVEPMRRALDEFGVRTWFTGLRRSQAASRRNTPIVELRNGRYKVSPLADWTDRDVWVYLKKHDLPYHPLWHEGYVSIGDFHTTSRWEPGMRDEDTRFFGLKRECGIHEEI